MYTLLWNLLIGNNCRHLASEKLVSLSCHCVHSTCEDLRGTFSSKLFATGALSPLPPEIEPFHGYFWGLSTAPRVCKDSSEVDLSNSRSKLSGFHPSGRAQGGALVSALWHKGPFAWNFIFLFKWVLLNPKAKLCHHKKYHAIWFLSRSLPRSLDPWPKEEGKLMAPLSYARGHFIFIFFLGSKPLCKHGSSLKGRCQPNVAIIQKIFRDMYSREILGHLHTPQNIISWGSWAVDWSLSLCYWW